jgi:Tfp pilus assembly protein PilN
VITINLLVAGRAQGARRRVADAGRIAIVGLGVGLAAYGFYLRDLRANLIERTQAIEQRRGDAANSAKRLDMLRKRHAELTVQIAAIRGLLARRGSAAELFEAIDRSVTNDVWLVEVRRSAGLFQIDGRSSSLSAISRLVQRLAGNFSFQAALGIRQTTIEGAGGSSLIRFQVASEHAVAAVTTAGQ